MDEGQQIVGQRLRLNGRIRPGDGHDGKVCVDDGLKRNSHIILQHQPDHPQSRTPQRIRIFRASRLLVNRPKTHQRVELVGQSHRNRHWSCGHKVARPLRFVMFFNRCAHVRMFALQRGVAAAHQALRLGEFAHDFGRQIGLAQLRCAIRQLRIGAHKRRQGARQSADALDAFALRPKLFVEHDVERLQFCKPLVERPGAVLLRDVIRQRRLIGLPEIQSVGQARAHHAGVAAGDRYSAVAGFNIGDEQELVRQSPIGMAQHEAFLVGANGGAHHFGGNVEKGFVERAHQHHRPFNKTRDFLQQAFVFNQLQPLRKSQIFGIVQNDVLAPL